MTEHLQPGVSAHSVELVAYRRFPNWKLQMSCSWAAEGGGGSADKVVGPDTHISDKQIFHAGTTDVGWGEAGAGIIGRNTAILFFIICFSLK
ncbi:MAG: hypothetical protein FRX49_04764 [Trebouxia sp. A1-2]|nr:MAG: hypothetical protein FRX49_04764 [Trebouxia sp. A1-2]